MTEPQGNEDYEARIKQLESEKKGILRDVQGEREKRHALEREIEEIRARQAQPPEEPMAVDARINEFAKNPDAYISKVTQKSINDALEKERINRKFEEAYEWAAGKLGKSVDEIRNSDIDQDFVRIAKENSINVGQDPTKGMKTILRFYQLEQEEKENQEKARQAKITSQKTDHGAPPARSGPIRFSRSQIKSMSLSDFQKNQDAIREAQAAGLISDD